MTISLKYEQRAIRRLCRRLMTWTGSHLPCAGFQFHDSFGQKASTFDVKKVPKGCKIGENNPFSGSTYR
jgi:hypothetical protein